MQPMFLSSSRPLSQVEIAQCFGYTVYGSSDIVFYEDLSTSQLSVLNGSTFKFFIGWRLNSHYHFLIPQGSCCLSSFSTSHHSWHFHETPPSCPPASSPMVPHHHRANSTSLGHHCDSPFPCSTVFLHCPHQGHRHLLTPIAPTPCCTIVGMNFFPRFFFQTLENWRRKVT